MVCAGDRSPARCAATIAAMVSVTRRPSSARKQARRWRRLLSAKREGELCPPCSPHSEVAEFHRDRSNRCAICTPKSRDRLTEMAPYYQVLARISRPDFSACKRALLLILCAGFLLHPTWLVWGGGRVPSQSVMWCSRFGGRPAGSGVRRCVGRRTCPCGLLLRD